MNIQEQLELIDDSLPGIVILSHGSLATGISNSLKLITGETKNIFPLVLEESDDPAEYGQRIIRVCDKLSDNIFIFIDMFGGTPSNQFILNSKDINKKFFAFAGVNLPMVIEVAVGRRYESAEKLADMVRKSASESFVDINAVVTQLLEEEE